MRKKSVSILLIFALYALCALLVTGCAVKSEAVAMKEKTPDDGFYGSITPQQVETSSSSDAETHEEWTPEIIDLDENYTATEYDDSVKYEYTSANVKFNTVSGSFTQIKGAGEFNDYTVAATNSLAVCDTETPFPYGTFSCDVKTVAGFDSGIVYGLSTDRSMFWESGVSYYIFLLSADGRVYLGKIDDGTWTVLKRASYSFNTVDTFSLKVVYKNYKSYCYVNGTLLIEYKERNPLKGTGFGIRGGGEGAVFSNISLTNDYLI